MEGIEARIKVSEECCGAKDEIMEKLFLIFWQMKAPEKLPHCLKSILFIFQSENLALSL